MKILNVEGFGMALRERNSDARTLTSQQHHSQQIRADVRADSGAWIPMTWVLLGLSREQISPSAEKQRNVR